MAVLDRFLHYVTFDTQSSETTGVTPSTPGQRRFAEALVAELQAIGLEEISLDENGYLMMGVKEFLLSVSHSTSIL